MNFICDCDGDGDVGGGKVEDNEAAGQIFWGRVLAFEACRGCPLVFV